jgi:hypothetical protein
MNVLSGYRTYLIAACLVIVSGLHAEGYITDTTYHALQGLLLGGGLASLRAAVGKS